MDRGWEWERKLEGLRKQKNKLLEEKSRLLDELRLQITAVDKTEGNLENVRRQINHCDSQMRDPLAEAFDELVPPGNSEQRTMALKGWIEIRKILKNKDVWSQTAYQVCKEIYESIIEPNESKGCPSELACNPLMSSGKLCFAYIIYSKMLRLCRPIFAF